MTYTCDNWVVIKMKGEDPHYRLLVGTSGGYTTGDSWRLNSGIVRVTEDEYYFYFYGLSGSCYQCHKNAYCLRKNNAYIWSEIEEIHGDKVELMPEDTDWMNTDWEIKMSYTSFVKLWEQKHGPVPENYAIKHVDGNDENCLFENLTINGLGLFE